MSTVKRIGDFVIDKKKRLGKGTFASVYKGVHQRHHYPVAGKVIDLGTKDDHEDSVPFALNEVSVMEKVTSHPNILHLLHHDIIHDDKNDVHELWLVTKFCDAGSLNEYFCTRQPTDVKILRFVKQICEAMCFLHSNGIVHNDLKPANVLLAREIGTVVVKVADFGLSDATNRDYMSVKGGSYHYMSPELFATGRPTHTKKSDVFAFGVLIIHLLKDVYGKKLESREIRGDRYIGQVMYEKLLKREPVDAPVRVTETDTRIRRELKLLAADMTQPQHRDRPDMGEVHSRLMVLREEDDEEVVDEVERKEVDIHATNKKQPSLHDAAINSQLSVAEMLITEGADVNAQDEKGHTRLHFASWEGHLQVVEMLVGKGADVNVTSKKKQTPLHRASWNGHVTVAEMLVTEGADVNAQDEDGDTPLHDTSRQGHLQVAQMLVGKGADVNVTSKKKQTPLHWAAFKGHRAVAEMLITEGADVNAQDENGSTQLHLALQEGHIQIAEMLVGKGADINATDKWKQTPLHLAYFKGHRAVAEMFITEGADVNAQTEKGHTPLHGASRQGHLQVAQMLVGKGADINVTSKKKQTPLHWAALRGHCAVAEMLITEGANVNAQDEDGRTPLHFASQEGHIQVAEMLVGKGANVNLKSHDGRTPLIVCAEENQIEIARLLLKNGAKLNKKNQDGATALSIARDSNQSQMVDFLSTYHSTRPRADEDFNMTNTTHL